MTNEPDSISETFNMLGDAIYQLLSPRDTRIEYRVSAVRGTTYTTIDAYNPEGQFGREKDPFNALTATDETLQAARNLRAACYRDGAGTWFSAVFTVTSQGAATAEYNYDEEPEWDAPIDAALYANDQDKFPRDESAQPDWLKQKIAEGRAQIIAQKNRTRRL